MDIDFIKWMISYAEGFRFGKRKSHDQWSIYFDDSNVFECTALEAISHFVKNDHYIILLQRAIEGINKFEDYDIIQTRSNVSVFRYAKNQEPKHFELEPTKEDEAKEQALKYIYKQEQIK